MNKPMTKKIVTISSPEMGIAKRIPNIQRTSLFTTLSEFVRGIIGHYVRLQEPWPMIALVFRQLGMGDTFLNSYHTHITPRLHFTLLRWHAGSPSSPDHALPPLRLQTITEAVGPWAKPTSAYRIEQIAPDQVVRRLFARSQRIEIQQRTQYVHSRQDSYREALTDAPEPPLEPEYRHVRRIVRHGKAPEPERTISPIRNESEPLDVKKKREEAQKAQPPAISSIDVNRLTEEVIQAIDRRIASQRERMGRP